MAFDRQDDAASNPQESRPEPDPETASASTPPPPPRATSERRRVASQANGRKSRGPVSEAGKRRSSKNARKFPVRLLGLAEAKILNQEPGAAERLYRELIAPYEPAPAVLRMHFQDLARERLELEAWERIRDAQFEDRWQQNDLERRRKFYEMGRELSGTLKQIAEQGLQGSPPSPAKFKQQMDALGALREQLTQRQFGPELGLLLRHLYGKDLDPQFPRAQTICIRCERLMNPGGSEPLSEEQFEGLLDLVAIEEQDAITAYGLEMDGKTMTRAACLGRLGPTRDDHWMDRRGERLRQAIDRKQWVIIGLLQTLGLAARSVREAGDGAADEGSAAPAKPPKRGVPPSPRVKKCKNEPEKLFRINKTIKKRT